VIRPAAVLAALLTALALVAAPSAGAHAARIGENPTDGSALAVPPTEVQAVFNEPMQPHFAAMTVIGPDGGQWQDGDPVVEGAVVKVAVRPLGPAGSYTVNYRATSADGHVVTGSWSFELTTPGPGATTAPAAPAEPARSEPAPGEPASGEAAAPAGSGASGGVPVWPFVAVAVLLVAAGVWWAVRRRA